MAARAIRYEMPVNSAPHTKLDINAPERKFPVSSKMEGINCPRLRGLASRRFHAHFPAHDCAWGGNTPLNSRLCRPEQANLFDGMRAI